MAATQSSPGAPPSGRDPSPSCAAEPWRMRHFIDGNKRLTALVVLLLMAYAQAWDNPVAWIYLAEHGLYGLLWNFKSKTFADKQFEQPISLRFGVQIFIILSLYWVTPWLITQRPQALPAWALGLSVALFASGVFWHFTSDMQKYMALQLRPGQLLRSGLWQRCRNPNYFGELLIYGGFTMLAGSWIPFVPLGVMIAGVWVPNIRRKEASLARYPEFAAWKARSGCLFPAWR